MVFRVKIFVGRILNYNIKFIKITAPLGISNGASSKTVIVF